MSIQNKVHVYSYSNYVFIYGAGMIHYLQNGPGCKAFYLECKYSLAVTFLPCTFIIFSISHWRMIWLSHILKGHLHAQEIPWYTIVRWDWPVSEVRRNSHVYCVKWGLGGIVMVTLINKWWVNKDRFRKEYPICILLFIFKEKPLAKY